MNTEDLLRQLAPQALGVIARRYGDFADAEDAVQEALLAASTTWPRDGRPDHPLAWLVRAASRRMANEYRAEDARRRREDLAASWSLAGPGPSSGRDDTLIVMFMCCHPALAPSSAIPLTLRAVGGLSTRHIANAFLVPETTMAQRISRAKSRIRAEGARFAPPLPPERDQRLRSVLHVLYLIFNEGYATSSGPDLGRPDLGGEGIRLARMTHEALPEDPEVSGLLALMLLTEARRTARTDADGELVPLTDQNRQLWDRTLIAEGTGLITAALERGTVGEYQIQAAIAALHDQADHHTNTDWAQIVSLYRLLESMTGNPMVALNRAVAAAMAEGPDAGLAILDGLDGGGRGLGDHYRLHAARAHLLELAGDRQGAVSEFTYAAARTTNLRERNYLTTKAAQVAANRSGSPGGKASTSTHEGGAL